MAQLASLSPAYQEAKRRLLERLRHQWPEGGRLPAITDLARELGIGQRNVHRAVRELVVEGMLISRPRLGTFVASAPKPRPASSNWRIHAYCATGRDSDPFLLQMHRAFADLLAAHKLRSQLELYDPAAALPLNPDADAVVIFNPPSDCSFSRFHEQQLLMVVSTADQVIDRLQRYDLISVDEEQGATLAGQCLRRASCRAVCYLGHSRPGEEVPTHEPISAIRLAGLERGWGQTIPAAYQLWCESWDESSGARAVNGYLRLSPRADGIFAASDELAVGFVHGALAHGLEPGRDYQIVGFDGQERGRKLPEGPLTTVEVPREQMGRRAAELLVDRFSDPDQPPRKLYLGCTLLPGRTVRSVQGDGGNGLSHVDT